MGTLLKRNPRNYFPSISTDPTDRFFNTFGVIIEYEDPTEKGPDELYSFIVLGHRESQD